MIPSHLISALANHLWQSTIFAAVAGLLAFALRKNHARTRHWIWLIASCKFLVPFSLLAAMGGHLGSSAPAMAPAGFYGAVAEIGQSFIAPAAPSAIPAVTIPAATNPMPVILFVAWACGFIAVVFSWWIRWRRIDGAVRAASPLPLATHIQAMSSTALLEPGVFGIFRPVLLLPEGITERLAPAHLQAILAHELCHVRRRDNLTAAIHMLVEALFWFHPLVWWIGARLVEERERACDEEVLRLGNQPQIYAESILKTCEFYLESPLACMSGVTGSDLKKRIVRIMAARVAKRLDFGRKLLLAAVGFAVAAGPIVFGLANAAPRRAQAQTSSLPTPSFEVASIKPNHSADRRVMMGNSPGMFTASNVTVKTLIQMAYKVQDFQITAGPGWINSDRFDIEAKPEGASGADMQKMNEDQREAEMERRRLMLQTLLADRFKLTFHRETKELPVYALVVAKGGPKLHQSAVTPVDSEPSNPQGPKGPQFKGRGMRVGRGQLSGQAMTLSFLADALSDQLGRTVVDKTGLKGAYDFTLQWTPDESQGRMFNGPGDGKQPSDSAPPPDASGPSIFTAIQEQLGLKLESQKGSMEILAIDHVEQPSEN